MLTYETKNNLNLIKKIERDIMLTKKICKTLLKVFAIAFFAKAAYAEVTLKLGTTGRLGMPIGDAIDQALIPAFAKASGGKIKI